MPFLLQGSPNGISNTHKELLDWWLSMQHLGTLLGTENYGDKRWGIRVSNLATLKLFNVCLLFQNLKYSKLLCSLTGWDSRTPSFKWNTDLGFYKDKIGSSSFCPLPHCRKKKKTNYISQRQLTAGNGDQLHFRNTMTLFVIFEYLLGSQNRRIRVLVDYEDNRMAGLHWIANLWVSSIDDRVKHVRG